MTQEESIAVWIGSKYATIGTARINANGSVDVREHPAVPFLSKFYPIVGGKQLPFQTRKLFHPTKGDLGVSVIIFPFDLQHDPYMPLLNDFQLRELESLRIERNYLYNEVVKLRQKVHGYHNEEKIKEKLLEDLKFYRKATQAPYYPGAFGSNK